MSTMNELRRDLFQIFNLLLEEKATAEMIEALKSLRPVIQSGTIEEIVNEYDALIKLPVSRAGSDLLLEMGWILEAYINDIKRTPNMCRYCSNPKLRAGVGLCEVHLKESQQPTLCTIM